MSSTKRIEYIDLAKGICISFVVLYHIFRACMIGQSFEGTPVMAFLMNDLLGSFRMPFYFFLSGLFYKQYEGKFTFIKKKINKLLIPFLFVFIVTIVLRNIAEYIINPSYDIDALERDIISMKPNTPIWFLLCLFNLNIIYFIIDKNLKNKTIMSIILTLICLLGFYLRNIGAYEPFYIISALTFMPFYLGGYWIRKKTDLLSKPFSKKDWGLILFFFILLFANTYLYGISYYNNQYLIIEITHWVIGGFSGTFAMIILAKRIKKLPVISYVGRYSIVVLCTHLLVIRVIFHIWPLLPPISLGAKIFIELIVVLLISVPIIKFCIRYLPYFFAQKDVIKC